MLSTFIIVFREVLEAMLVVGIASAAAREVGISPRWIYGGLFGGLMAAFVVAVFADMIASSASGMGQELFNAAVLASASALMIWTAIWMGKHGRELSARIKQVCQTPSDTGDHASSFTQSTPFILASIIALAVTREGAEVVLFLHGVAAEDASGSAGMFGGAALGVLMGVMVAVLLYRSLLHIPIRHVFTVVTMLIVLLAAGMASQAASYLVMVDAIPALGQTLWNTSGFISERSIPGQLLHALMGYDDRPSGMQVLTFILVLLASWTAIRMQKKPPKNRLKKAAHNTAILLLLPILSLSILPHHAEAKKVYSPIVEAGEVEFEYLLDYSLDSDPTKNTNTRHQFELEYAITDRWLTSVTGGFRKLPSQRFAYQGMKWENIYQLFAQGEYWLDAGLYLEYFIPQGLSNNPHGLEFKLLLEKQTGHLIHTANILFKKELGNHASNKTQAAYAWKTTWRWHRYLEPGIEAYGSIGTLGNSKTFPQQSHQIGPVLTGKLRNGFTYEAGYLFGLTTNTDQGLIKFVIGYEF